ncbi:MAG TPA: alpha/beta fold hydrolase [Polyangiaceae bacterium]
MSTTFRLGRLGFEVRDVGAWEAFATQVLGLEVGARAEGSLSLRCDDWAERFVLTQGTADDVTTFAWEVDDDDALGAAARRLRLAGVEVREGTDEEARRRSVARFVAARDPAGHPVEVFFGAARAPTRFRSERLVSSFVTGDQGLGHVVVSATDPEKSRRFYTEVLGFRLSDRIACAVHGHPVDVTFLHGGPRHHAVAIGGPHKKRVHHFMLEVASMDDVGLAFDRALGGGVRILQTLGRHPNDRMFSFYARTPSGFAFEYGWGGRTVDDTTWTPTTYDRISEWGHHPPLVFAPSAPAPAPAPAPALASPVPEGRFVAIGDGLRVHYHEYGVGPAVLFLHGSGPGASGWSNFRHNVPAFVAAGFRVLLPDTLGYGYSSKPDVDYTLDFLEGAVERFLGATGVTSCAVVGNSHGGAMAIRLATRRSELVRRLVLMAPGGLEERETYVKMEGIRAMMKAFTDPAGITRASMRRVFEKQLFDPSLVTEELLDERTSIAELQPKRVLTSMQVPNLAEELAAIACPVLAFWGVDDKFCPMSGAITIATRCKDARVELLTGCGHWVMVEKRAVFDDASTRFLRGAAAPKVAGADLGAGAP